MEKRWLRHLLLWLPYLILESYTEAYWMELQYQQGFWLSLWHAFLEEFSQILVIKMPMVYLMFYVLEKFSHQSRNWLKLISSLVIILLLFAIAGYHFIVHLVIPIIYSHLEIVGFYGFSGIMNSFMDKIFIACVAISLKEYYHSQKMKEREKNLLREKTETELNFLKSQINPHFLFNTLNNIYSLARKKSDETPDVVLKLSKLLRFVLYETKGKFISITKEVEFLNDYIDLQKIRFDKRLSVVFHSEIDDVETLIMPLVLIPFVENAFKHGASQSTAEAYVEIYLKIEGNELRLQVENSFESQGSESQDGIGLKNLQRQLELVYRKFILETDSEKNKFKARLYIDLNQCV